MSSPDCLGQASHLFSSGEGRIRQFAESCCEQGLEEEALKALLKDYEFPIENQVLFVYLVLQKCPDFNPKQIKIEVFEALGDSGVTAELRGGGRKVESVIAQNILLRLEDRSCSLDLPSDSQYSLDQQIAFRVFQEKLQQGLQAIGVAFDPVILQDNFDSFQQAS